MADADPTAPRRFSIWPLLWVAAIGVALATLAGWAGRWHAVLDLASHFQAHYLGVDLALAALALAGRRWRLVAAALVLALLHAATLAPAWVPPARPTPTVTAVSTAAAVERRVRILFLNVEKPNHDHARVLALVAELDPDIAAFLEADHDWVAALQPLRASHPHVIVAPRADAFGAALFSRLPGRGETRLLGGELPSLVWRLDGLTVVATHPPPPMRRSWAAWRDAQLAELATLARGESQPVALGGDLNCTPWSPHFADLLRDGGLIDSRRGFGHQATWPASLPGLRIPIDHCLVSPSVRVLSRRVGPPVGSDHLPVLVELAY